MASAVPLQLPGASFAVCRPGADALAAAFSVPRQRSARVVGEQAVILVDETFLSSPTAVPLLVGEGPVDECVLLRNVSRSYRQLAKSIIRFDVHRIDDDGSTVAEDLRAAHANFMEDLGLRTPHFAVRTPFLSNFV